MYPVHLVQSHCHQVSTTHPTTEGEEKINPISTTDYMQKYFSALNKKILAMVKI